MNDGQAVNPHSAGLPISACWQNKQADFAALRFTNSATRIFYRKSAAGSISASTQNKIRPKGLILFWGE